MTKLDKKLEYVWMKCPRREAPDGGVGIDMGGNIALNVQGLVCLRRVRA